MEETKEETKSVHINWANVISQNKNVIELRSTRSVRYVQICIALEQKNGECSAAFNQGVFGFCTLKMFEIEFCISVTLVIQY